uniref:Uncharacterized protein n=1 Tax=Anabas testudineus TaxID=64144 RepID=A0A7N6C1V0_ANATE
MWPNNRFLFYLLRHPTSQQHYNSTHRKKSKVRLNDQLKKMLTIASPKEHPYSSHISRLAVFPSFCSPDDPHTGVRAASQPFLTPLIPTSAPDTTVISKTIGGPYRHEITETPMKARKKAVTWPGEHGFLDPLKEKRQVFYPTPPKTVLPNSKLRDWDLTLSHRTSNMLKNLERALWVTSYQMHYTGSGPANPLKIDDFKEKILAGINSHTAPLAGIDSHPELLSSAASVQEKTVESRELSCIISNPYIAPRSQVLPGIHPVDRVGTVGRESAALSLLDVQNSFSKSEAHRNFNSSITHAAVDLRDNAVTGKKHDFYGINCYYLRG